MKWSVVSNVNLLLLIVVDVISIINNIIIIFLGGLGEAPSPTLANACTAQGRNGQGRVCNQPATDGK